MVTIANNLLTRWNQMDNRQRGTELDNFLTYAQQMIDHGYEEIVRPLVQEARRQIREWTTPDEMEWYEEQDTASTVDDEPNNFDWEGNSKRARLENENNQTKPGSSFLNLLAIDHV